MKNRKRDRHIQMQQEETNQHLTKIKEKVKKLKTVLIFKTESFILNIYKNIGVRQFTFIVADAQKDQVQVQCVCVCVWNREGIRETKDGRKTEILAYDISNGTCEWDRV